MVRHDENALIIYTDGSCKEQPRRGGYAFILLTEDQAGEELLLKYNPPGELGATNIEMELKACIEALRLVTSQHPPVPKSSYRKVVIYADLALISESIRAAESTWPERGWLTRENEPVMNADLWQELVRLKRKAGRVEIRHVKGHKKNPYNNKADQLAKESADLAWQPQRSPKKVARKKSSRQTVARVVPMRGQTEIIRIVVVRAIPGSRTTPTSTRSWVKTASTSKPSMTALRGMKSRCAALTSTRCVSPMLTEGAAGLRKWLPR